MKNALLTFLAAVGFWLAAVSMQAQGTLSFANNTSPTPCITSNTLTGATAKITAGNFVFGLYVGTTTNALLSSVTPVLIVTNTGLPPGFISGSTFTLANFPQGTTLIFEVKGWSVLAGAATFETASFGEVPGSNVGGVSQIGRITLSGIGNPSSIFGSTGGAVPSPVLVTPFVPEPSTVAVGGLGAVALAFFRRRK